MTNCNNDLKLFTAKLYLYRNHINNPIKESFYQDRQFLSTYFQTEEDWVYSAFVSCCFEKLYNFWDRIGDALAYYLKLDISEHSVNFPKVIEKMDSIGCFRENAHFKALKSFKDNQFKEFNKHRKEIVHYYQFETTFRYEHMKKLSNKEELTKLWVWKKSMPEYFKDHLVNSCEGFYNMYKLIESFS